MSTQSLKSLLELAYKGNVGIVEFVQFYHKASKEDQVEMDKAIAADDIPKVLELIKRVVGVDLVVSENKLDLTTQQGKDGFLASVKVARDFWIKTSKKQKKQLGESQWIQAYAGQAIKTVAIEVEYMGGQKLEVGLDFLKAVGVCSVQGGQGGYQSFPIDRTFMERLFKQFLNGLGD